MQKRQQKKRKKEILENKPSLPHMKTTYMSVESDNEFSCRTLCQKCQNSEDLSDAASLFKYLTTNWGELDGPGQLFKYRIMSTTETEATSCLMWCSSDVAVFSILHLQFVFCLLFWRCVLHFPTTVAFHADTVSTCVFVCFLPFNPTQLLCIYGNNNNSESWRRSIADGNENSVCHNGVAHFGFEWRELRQLQRRTDQSAHSHPDTPATLPLFTLIFELFNLKADGNNNECAETFGCFYRSCKFLPFIILIMAVVFSFSLNCLCGDAIEIEIPY